MGIQGSEISTPFVKEPVHVYLCNDETRRAASTVLENAFHVLCDAQVWCFQTVEDGNNMVFLFLILQNGSLPNGGQAEQS